MNFPMEHHLSPNDIEVLIHCHCRPEPHPRLDAPAVRDAINRFLHFGIIKISGKDMYNTTDRGDALMMMLCRTPFPESIWVDPRDRQPLGEIKIKYPPQKTVGDIIREAEFCGRRYFIFKKEVYRLWSETGVSPHHNISIERRMTEKEALSNTKERIVGDVIVDLSTFKEEWVWSKVGPGRQFGWRKV